MPRPHYKPQGGGGGQTSSKGGANAPPHTPPPKCSPAQNLNKSRLYSILCENSPPLPSPIVFNFLFFLRHLTQTGFMSAFTNLNPKSEKALMFNDTRHTSVKLSSLWINFLVNLSFSSDGQQMIIKQPGQSMHVP